MKKKAEECKKPPAWLTSFGDLMSLLLTFFILLYSMSIISLEKFFQALKGLVAAFGGTKVVYEESAPVGTNVPLNMENMYPRLKKFKELKKEIKELERELNSKGIKSDYAVMGMCMKLRVNTDRIFPPGSEEPYPEAVPILNEICTRLKKFSFPLIVEGHTDSRPINTPRYPSNWELSAARAVNVLRLFRDCGYPEELLAAAGYGEYRPISTEDTPLGREMNRRIEFCIKLNP
jgi:chemotaxis protein MotB